jgi:hypothetical protein
VRQDRRVGAWRAQVVDNLLDRDNRPARGQHHLLLDADNPFDQHIALPVGALRMDDPQVGPERGDRGQLLATKRAGDRADVRVDAHQVGALVAAQDRARQAGRSGGVGVGHRRVAMLLDLQRPRPAMLDGVAQAVQRPHAGVAAPRKYQLARAAHPDQLIVDQIGGHANERQVALLLSNDLVAGGEGDQVSEALQRDRPAIVNIGGDRGGERQEFGHRTFSTIGRRTMDDTRWRTIVYRLWSIVNSEC